ncbi:hypothetical protein OF83DRAFT_1084753 [Amylostereum chailletii]|nr:hypothetical protein OF83DRAFT_1084753 [Amylostereum chailletii]
MSSDFGTCRAAGTAETRPQSGSRVIPASSSFSSFTTTSSPLILLPPLYSASCHPQLRSNGNANASALPLASPMPLRRVQQCAQRASVADLPNDTLLALSSLLPSPLPCPSALPRSPRRHAMCGSGPAMWHTDEPEALAPRGTVLQRRDGCEHGRRWAVHTRMCALVRVWAGVSASWCAGAGQARVQAGGLVGHGCERGLCAGASGWAGGAWVRAWAVLAERDSRRRARAQHPVAEGAAVATRLGMSAVPDGGGGGGLGLVVEAQVDHEEIIRESVNDMQRIRPPWVRLRWRETRRDVPSSVGQFSMLFLIKIPPNASTQFTSWVITKPLLAFMAEVDTTVVMMTCSGSFTHANHLAEWHPLTQRAKIKSLIGFSAPALSTVEMVNFVLALVQLIYINNRQPESCFGELLNNSLTLGRHSRVVLFRRQVVGVSAGVKRIQAKVDSDNEAEVKMYHYIWSSLRVRPWGVVLPSQCPGCKRMWSANIEGNNSGNLDIKNWPSVKVTCTGNECDFSLVINAPEGLHPAGGEGPPGRWFYLEG